MSTFIRDKDNRIIGTLKVRGDQTFVYDSNQRIAGRMNNNTQYVYDKNERFVGRGSTLLGTLIKC